MSTNTACFLFGLAATAVWLVGFVKGVMPGRKATCFGLFGVGGWTLRSVQPVRFWLSAVLLGFLPLGLLVVPVLSWLGWRH